MSKVGKPLVVKRNPSIKEQHKEATQMQSHLKELETYIPVKILCSKQSRPIQSAMKEAIIEVLKKYNSEEMGDKRMEKYPKNVSIWGAVKLLGIKNKVSVKSIIDEAFRDLLKKYGEEI